MRNYRAWLCLATAQAVLAVAWPAGGKAQTLPPGVISAPPTVIGDSQSIGSDTTLNVGPGGSVGFGFQAGLAEAANVNTVVNVSGGAVANGLDVNTGAVVNVAGGELGVVDVWSGGVVNLSGGFVQDLAVQAGGVLNMSGGQTNVIRMRHHDWEINISGGDIGDTDLYTGMKLMGGEFRVNGVPVGPGLQSVLNATVSATLEDGTVLVREGRGQVVFSETSTPPLPSHPIVINSPVPETPSLRTGQELVLQDGGVLGPDTNAAIVGATFRIEGGAASGAYHLIDSQLDIIGGEINALGGVRASFGSDVNLSGGSLSGGPSWFEGGSTLSMVGGRLGDNFQADQSVTVNISGGVIGDRFVVDGGETNFHGGEFVLNGQVVTEGLVSVENGDSLTGALSDGTPFIFFGRSFGDRLNAVRLVPTGLPAADPTPLVVADDNAPNGLRPGQTLTLLSGGVLPRDFAAVGATLNIAGGTVQPGLQTSRSRVLVTAGSFALDSNRGDEIHIAGGRVSHLTANNGSRVIMTSGAIGYGSDANDGSRLEVSGGTIEAFFTAYSGSVVSISGGLVEEQFQARSGSRVNISGGQFDSVFGKFGSEFLLFGADFEVNGEPVGGENGAKTTVPSRSGLLTGTLLDGSTISLALSRFSSSADLSIVPMTLGALPGDYDYNGVVDLADLEVWKAGLGSLVDYRADGNRDGRVDAADYTIWRDSLPSGSSTLSNASEVPEPAACVGMLLACAAAAGQRRR